MLHCELELHYLPIWQLGSRRGVAGVEALLRWRHPDRGLLRPASFLNLADRSAVSDDVIDWALGEAFRHTAGWQERGLTPRISLNMSHHQLLAASFAERFLAGLADHSLDPASFLIELTESAWTIDAEETLAVVADLHASGATFAIDDFGAGYSSLSRLRDLAFDVIKIDRRLLSDVPGDPTAEAVMGAIVELAQACGAEVIAEGVESAEQLTFLSENGIVLVQGYLFGHPRPADEMTGLLERRLRADRARV